MIPRIDTTAAKPASLSERILAGDLSGLPEMYSDEEWRREAQGCFDIQDDEPLWWMVAKGREAEQLREREWQRETGRYSLNDYRDGFGPHPLKGMSCV